MSLREILGDLYTDEIGSKLQGYDVFKKGEAMPMDKYNEKTGELKRQKDELAEQVKTLNKTLTDNNAQIEKLKTAAGDNEELKKQLGEYQEKATKAQKDFDETLKAKEKEWATREVNSRKSFAVREKLLAENIKSNFLDMVMSTVDLEKVTEQDGKFIGIDDIVKATKEKYSDVFGVDQRKGTGVGGGTGGSGEKKKTLEELRKEAEGGSIEARAAYARAKMEMESEDNN